MNAKLISIVTAANVAGKIGPTLGRLLGLAIEVQNPGSVQRLVDRVLDCNPDVIVYTWSGDETGLLLWLKEQGLGREQLRFAVFTCKGFDRALAGAIDRLITKQGGQRRMSYAA